MVTIFSKFAHLPQGPQSIQNNTQMKEMKQLSEGMTQNH